MKIAVAQLNPTVGDFTGNRAKILHAIKESKKRGADVVLFSEMALVGYPAEDFLLRSEFLQQAERTLDKIVPATQGIAAILGTVRQKGGRLFNTAAVVSNGKIVGYQDKALLPTYDVFDEQRYFTAAGSHSLFQIKGQKIAITLCEDIWYPSKKLKQVYEKNPLDEVAALAPDLLFNLSASPYHFGKYRERLAIASQAARKVGAPLILCNQVGGNDSLIFDGYSLVIDSKGKIVTHLKGFVEDLQLIDTDHLTAARPAFPQAIDDLKEALVLGIRDYFYKSGFKKACLGLSGGIDSALTLCLGVEALGKEQLLAVYMPSPYSSELSRRDAIALTQNLGVQLIEIPIDRPFASYLELLNPCFNLETAVQDAKVMQVFELESLVRGGEHSQKVKAPSLTSDYGSKDCVNLVSSTAVSRFKGKKPDVTEENLQARIRGTILMALSNKEGYIVLSTGNKSELAMGYSTLYGDLTGGLAVLADVTKEKVYQLARHINRHKKVIPLSTIKRAPSAELRPHQKDSDSLPPYPLIDAVLEGYMTQNLPLETIAHKLALPLQEVEAIVAKILGSEYKRRQAPPGLRVSEKAFTAGRRFPIVQKFNNQTQKGSPLPN